MLGLRKLWKASNRLSNRGGRPGSRFRRRSRESRTSSSTDRRHTPIDLWTLTECRAPPSFRGMTRWVLATLLVAAACAGPAHAAESVIVLQETRTPAGTKQRPSVQHVVLLKNVSPSPVRGIRVTVEFYDFFGKLIWARSAVPTPASLGPGDTATLSITTPRLESIRSTRYRFEFGRSAPPARASRHPGRG